MLIFSLRMMRSVLVVLCVVAVSYKVSSRDGGQRSVVTSE